MQVIIYAHPENGKKEDLLKKIFQEVTSKSVMVFDLESLFDLLRLKISEQMIVIVSLISTEREIGVLSAATSFFFNARHIIILSDNKNDLTSKALSLQPSYLSYLDSGFEDVCAVLNKMSLRS